MKRRSAAVLALAGLTALLACTQSKHITHELIPLDAAHLRAYNALTLDQRQALNGSLEKIRPSYYPAVRYTFPANGGFAVLVSYTMQQKKNWIVLSSCYSPRHGNCKHECGVAFNFQYWQALAIMETGRCQDSAPIWRH